MLFLLRPLSVPVHAGEGEQIKTKGTRNNKHTSVNGLAFTSNNNNNTRTSLFSVAWSDNLSQIGAASDIVVPPGEVGRSVSLAEDLLK